ncbi:MAG: sulfotransferase [Hyphomicrobiaceae bacterium]|nr:sulfotransferase [Hyphomicrobiaceae bacterium]
MPDSLLFPNIKASLFIVTYGRSGSTLLQRILQTLPNSVIRGENENLLFKFYQLDRAFAQTAENASRRKGSHMPKSPWHGIELLRPDAFRRDLADLFIKQVLNADGETSYIGFKEIRWHNTREELADYLRFIEAAFPNPYFVFNSRNPEDVSQSAWFAKTRQNQEKAIRISNRMIAFFEANMESFGDRVIRTRYEDFSKNPKALAPLFERLGEKLDERRIAKVLKEPLMHGKKGKKG